MKEAKGSSISISKEQKTRKTWSQTVRRGDNSKTINVEELDNGGYLVTVDLNGKDKKGEWTYITKKYYSETNILDSDETDDPINIFYKQLSRNK